MLVPEISLTPQLMRRFEARLDGCLVTLHSGLNDTERLQNWLLAANGHADVVIGTRSAVLVPLPRLGLVVVDEEHDGSLKQQDGFRYHARDLALMRGRSHECPVVLGTATPALETLHNVRSGRFEELPLARRAGDAVPPVLALLDVRRRALVEGMSDRLLDAIARHLGDGGQAMVFVNRRGFAPTLLCNDCGAAAGCERCDANMTVHARSNRLRCHHCGAERAVPAACESCGSPDLDRVGYGTERIGDALEAAFPDVRVARIDRDSTRRKGALERQLELATSGEARLLVGTQMLAKGHHFPKLTLVGILDADRGLFGTDFRSLEHMGQLVVQVAGRAGREATRGTVLIQTRNPDNEMLGKLVHEGYAAFADALLDERRAAELPPYAFVALIRAESLGRGRRARLPAARRHPPRPRHARSARDPRAGARADGAARRALPLAALPAVRQPRDAERSTARADRAHRRAARRAARPLVDRRRSGRSVLNGSRGRGAGGPNLVGRFRRPRTGWAEGRC